MEKGLRELNCRRKTESVSNNLTKSLSAMQKASARQAGSQSRKEEREYFLLAGGSFT